MYLCDCVFVCLWWCSIGVWHVWLGRSYLVSGFIFFQLAVEARCLRLCMRCRFYACAMQHNLFYYYCVIYFDLAISLYCFTYQLKSPLKQIVRDLVEQLTFVLVATGLHTRWSRLITAYKVISRTQAVFSLSCSTLVTSQRTQRFWILKIADNLNSNGW